MSLPNRISIHSILGGAAFCAAMGAVGFPWTAYHDDVLVEIISGGVVGSLIGVFIVISFPKLHIEVLELLLRCKYASSDKQPLSTGFAGMRLARFVCLFYFIPFSILCSTVLISLLIIMIILSGDSSNVEFLNSITDDVFWMFGLYLHVVLIVSAVSWCVEYRYHRRQMLHFSKNEPTQQLDQNDG